MKKCVRGKSITIVLFIFYLFSLVAAEVTSDATDSEIPPHFYRCYEGTINNTYKIVLHLTKHNDTLSGYYYYVSQGIPLFLSGSSDTAGNFKLEESTRSGEKTGRFSGRFVNQNHIKGMWQTADKKKQFPFELKENHSSDYVQCTTVELEESHPLFVDTDSPKIEISLFYVYPIRYKNPQILKQLQKHIFVDNHDNPQKALEDMRDSYITVYTEENREIYEPDSDWMFMWQHIYRTSLVLNEKNMITVDFYFYDYMGGAHGLGGDGFITLDMTTGKKLELNDIFVTDFEQRLGDIMDKKVRASENIPPKASLEDHAFFVDKILPDQNFYVSLDGIGFYFNVYEIRPYAFGPTDVFLPFAEIGHLIKPNSPVRRLFE